MTMQDVLSAVQGMGERFDRHAKRLQALERETGMEPDPERGRRRGQEES